MLFNKITAPADTSLSGPLGSQFLLQKEYEPYNKSLTIRTNNKSNNKSNNKPNNKTLLLFAGHHLVQRL